ncbi:MAG: Asp-tRNA(Asn)/Glu-tRNA(Gln) amidotransferase GatCAB subunit A, partial [Gammaproteobacteria bacterium]
MHNKSIKELSQALAGKEISSVELTEYFLQRAEKFNAATNSYITITRETALEQAKAADQLIADGKGGTLTGIPLAHKDIFCTKGIKTSCGSKMLDNFDAPYNATVINKFADAGAVMLGKANMDEFAMGSSNENSYYGVV